MKIWYGINDFEDAVWIGIVAICLLCLVAHFTNRLYKMTKGE